MDEYLNPKPSNTLSIPTIDLDKVVRIVDAQNPHKAGRNIATDTFINKLKEATNFTFDSLNHAE